MFRYPPPMADPQVRSLMRRYRKDGDESALKRVIEGNIGLARRLAGQYHAPGVDFDDLFSEAMIGLIMGCRRYDPDRGTKISTYVAWWIRAYLGQHCMEQGGPVRFGQSTGDRVIYGALKAQSRLGRVDVELLAGQLGVTVDAVRRVRGRMLGRDVSLDQPVLGDGVALVDTLAADTPDPEIQAAASEEQAQHARRIQRALRKLPRRERLIIRRRLLVDEPETLASIGKDLGITRERVRQLEKRAKQKLHAALAA